MDINKNIALTCTILSYHLMTKAMTTYITRIINAVLEMRMLLYNTACCLVHAYSSIEYGDNILEKTKYISDNGVL